MRRNRLRRMLPLMGGAPQRTDGIISSGLVIEYAFNEGSGQIVHDLIGGYDAILGSSVKDTTADPAWVTEGLNFDDGEYIASATAPDALFTGAMSAMVVLRNEAATAVHFASKLGPQDSVGDIPFDFRTYGPVTDLVLGRQNATQASSKINGKLLDINTWKVLGFTAPVNQSDASYIYHNADRYYARPEGQALTGSPTGNNETLRLGGRAGSFDMLGDIAYALFYNRQLSQEEYEQNYKALITKMALRSITLPAIGTSVYCVGDSLTNGLRGTALHDYPAVLKATLGAGYDVMTFGVTGKRLDDILTDAAMVDASLSSERTTQICVLWAGGNDIDGGVAAATVYGNLTTFVTGRLTAGWDHVVVLTALDRAQYDEAQRTQWGIFNTSIKNGAETGGYTVVDVAGNANLDDFTDTTYFDADQVHLTDAGYAVVAGMVATAVAAL